ncbi:MAG TPA: LysM peptidoglycan-binding domain-containing protein [Bacillales bacterium]
MKQEYAGKTSWSYIIVFVVLLILTFFVLKASVASAKPDEYVKIVIAKGDTLWEISESYGDQSDLSRPRFINWTIERNHIQVRRLIPGQSIIIPVKKQ